MPAAGRRNPKRQRLNKRIRNQFEPFYADDRQDKETNFWPSVGLMRSKRQIAVKPLPPVGMNILNRNVALVPWHEPANTNGLRDWVEQACAANAELILSEFRQENAIRYYIGDTDFDIILHNGMDVLPVKASIFFGADVIRFGSWSFYCKLLVYMHDNGYNLNAIDGVVDWSKRSHSLMFMSSHLPLSYLSAFPRNTTADKDVLVTKLVDCMAMFVAFRAVLFGVGHDHAMDPHENYIGELIINTDNNSVTRLSETLRLSPAVKFICDAPLSDWVSRRFDPLWDEKLEPRVLMDLIGFKQQVPLLRPFNEARKMFSVSQPVVRNLNTTNIPHEKFLDSIRSIVVDVFGDKPWWDVSFSMRTVQGDLDLFEMSRLSSALCLLQLAYGSRYAGVLLYNKIVPVSNYLDELGVDAGDYSVFDEGMQTILNLQSIEDARLVVTGICKQKNEFGVRCLLTELFDAPLILNNLLDHASVEMHRIDMPGYVYPVIFFRLLAAVRRAVFTVFTGVDITWDTYDVRLSTEIVRGIPYIKKRDEDTLLIRQMKSFMYASVNDIAKTISIDGMPNITTHDLRRLYAACAYYTFARRDSMVKTEFVRTMFSHDSDAARRYTMVNITD